MFYLLNFIAIVCSLLNPSGSYLGLIALCINILVYAFMKNKTKLFINEYTLKSKEQIMETKIFANTWILLSVALCFISLLANILSFGISHSEKILLLGTFYEQNFHLVNTVWEPIFLIGTIVFSFSSMIPVMKARKGIDSILKIHII